MESEDQVMVLCGSSLHLNHYKLSDITAGKLLLFINNNSKKAMAFEWHQLSTRGFHRVRKKLQKNADCYLPRKCSAQNESGLDQQSISGKIVSLILWVWKLSYVKYGHILYVNVYLFRYLKARLNNNCFKSEKV